MLLYVVFSLLGSAFAQYQTSPNTTSPLLTVNTTSGAYTGFINSSLPQVHQWHGIRFGTPPTSNLRFQPAVKAPYFWTLVPEFQNTDPQSEDCLYLNIWAPRTPAVSGKKVPVLIWVVGGAFNEGGGHAPYQVPDRWIERTQTHIVVTFK
jgi:carboxylesterase type B